MFLYSNTFKNVTFQKCKSQKCKNQKCQDDPKIISDEDLKIKKVPKLHFTLQCTDKVKQRYQSTYFPESIRRQNMKLTDFQERYNPSHHGPSVHHIWYYNF